MSGEIRDGDAAADAPTGGVQTESVEPRGGRALTLAWAGVIVLGVIVVILVVSWQLFPRLTAAQSMVDDLNPAFTVDRVKGDRGGIEMVSAATNAADAMMYSDGAAAEVPKLIDFIAAQTGRSKDDVQAMLNKDYPHINGFLTSLPLYDVGTELPKLVHYLGTVLFMTPDQVDHLLATDYPKIYQVTVNLPKLTAGWKCDTGHRETDPIQRHAGAHHATDARLPQPGGGRPRRTPAGQLPPVGRSRWRRLPCSAAAGVGHRGDPLRDDDGRGDPARSAGQSAAVRVGGRPGGRCRRGRAGTGAKPVPAAHRRTDICSTTLARSSRWTESRAIAPGSNSSPSSSIPSDR